MKYVVIIGGNPYVIMADSYELLDSKVVFVDENPRRVVAEFKADRIDGVIKDDMMRGE